MLIFLSLTKDSMDNFLMRKAEISDLDRIWELLKAGILKRKNEGSDQWQNGYPNPEVVRDDIEKGYGIVVENDQKIIVGYVALIDAIEPAYEEIEGAWLTNESYVVLHRLIVDLDHPIKGLASWMMKNIERFVTDKNVFSIKVDTNFDNIGMLKVFERLGYSYCGKVYFNNAERRAFEKTLSKS